MDKKRLKVLAFPKSKNYKSNPYNKLLYDDMNKISEFEVDEFSIKNLLTKKYNVIHIHWPEYFLNSHYVLKAFLYNIIFLLGGLYLQRKLGCKVVWTVHNIVPHEIKYKSLSNIFWRYFPRLVDGAISLSKENQKIAANSISGFNSLKVKKIIYHGLYDSVYLNSMSKSNCRKLLSLNDSDKVVLILGQIKKYKNVESLVNVFNEYNLDGKYKLIIAGKFESEEYYNYVKSSIKSDNIIIHNKFIPDDEVQIYYNSADLSVIPFKNIFNSGSMLLSVSFNCKVLVPHSPAFSEYKEMLGGNIITTYEDELSMSHIANCIEDESNVPFDKTNLMWDEIRSQTVNMYREVLC